MFIEVLLTGCPLGSERSLDMKRPPEALCRTLLPANAFLFKQQLHSTSDIVSYRADYIHWLPLRVREMPITSTKAGHIRALVAAAHRNEKLSVSRQFLCQLLGLGMREIDSDLLHRRLHFRVNSQTRLCPG